MTTSNVTCAFSSDWLKRPTRICSFLKGVFLFQNIFVQDLFLSTKHGANHGDGWCLCMKHLPNFVPKHCLNDKCIHLNVLCLGFDYHQQYEEMFCSYAHPFMGVWRVGYQRDNRVDQVEWSVVKSILLRYFEPNSHSVCSYDNPLKWW